MFYRRGMSSGAVLLVSVYVSCWCLTLGVILYITIIHILLYYILYYIILYLILYSSLLLFFLPSLLFPFLLLLSSSVLYSPSPSLTILFSSFPLLSFPLPYIPFLPFLFFPPLFLSFILYVSVLTYTYLYSIPILQISDPACFIGVDG